MFIFFLRRVALLIPTFIGVTLIAFFFIRILPGDPIIAMAGERGLTPERYQELFHQYGMDRPLYMQYLEYLWNVLHGDLGTSSVTKKPVLAEFGTLFPATLELSICAIIVAIVIGVPAGIFAAVKRGTWFDQSVMGIALVGYSMPIFWWGLLLIIFFSGYLGWTPVSGRISLMYFFKPVTGFMLIDSLLSGQHGAFKSAVSYLILPTVVLATIPLAVIARQTRSAMLEVLGEDYVRTARAKGINEVAVMMRHALRNAAVPVITVIGTGFALLISGVVVTESVFNIPGIGRLTVDAVLARDYPVIQAMILLTSLIYVVVNLLIDVAYTLLDPRIRY